METQFDKVVLLKKEGEIKGVIIQDGQKRVFYKVEEMGMEDMAEILNTHGK